MTACESIHPQLVGFHFGVATPAERESIEAHLMTCRTCLRELLDVKSAIETGADTARPSDAVRLRIRNSIARTFEPPRRWWDKPAAFAFAASMLAASWAAMSALTG